jgi:glycosyltransferase involved in cell wall biosynthesis
MSRPLRFAMLTTFYPPHHFGGDGTYVRGLAHALARRGHHVTVVYDCDAYRLAGGVEKEPLEEPEGVVVHGLRSQNPVISCLATHQFGKPVVHGTQIAQILSQGFDVINFHNISLLGGPGILEYGDGLKIYTTHEHWLVCPSHILWRHNRELCTGKQCLRCVAFHGRPPQLWRSTGLLERNCKHIDAFATLSQSCADNHREFGFKYPMQVMAPFLPDEPSAAPLSPPASSPARPYYLFAGRLELIKGLQDVITAFEENSPMELWIAGEGNYESELKRLANGNNAIRFLGHQSQPHLKQLYQNARAVVMPSLCYEVFPMVVLEAFREGTPIIARARGPYPDIVRESEGGLLFETQTDLKAAMNRMAIDDELRQRLSRQALAAFERNWTESAGLDSYFAIIRQVAERRGNTDVVQSIDNAKSERSGQMVGALARGQWA